MMMSFYPAESDLYKMARIALLVLAADIVLLAALYYVLQDFAWRTYYAGIPHGSTATGYAPSFSYSFLIRIFTMSGSGTVLTSPPMLDMVQILAIILASINGWYAYKIFASWRARPAANPSAVAS